MDDLTCFDLDYYDEMTGFHRAVYVVTENSDEDTFMVVRCQRHRANLVIASCPTREAAHAALRLFTLETNHGN